MFPEHLLWVLPSALQEAFDTMAAQKGREGRRKSDPKIQLILDRRTSET